LAIWSDQHNSFPGIYSQDQHLGFKIGYLLGREIYNTQNLSPDKLFTVIAFSDLGA
jgi:hypothetical protein